MEKKHVSPRCMIQVDLKKAYDTVEWHFVEGIMREPGFPMMFVEWSNGPCWVKTVSYRYDVNGCQNGILEAWRGVALRETRGAYIPFFSLYW